VIETNLPDIIDKLIEQAYVEVPHERDEGFTQRFDKRLFAKMVAEECASLAYSLVPNGDIVASAILYEFDIDGTRNLK
jgi:hypothetical protein